MERTYLFVPANRYNRIVKATSSKADVVIIDLEDAVADDAKEYSRNNVISFLTNDYNGKKPVFIRINSMNTTFWESDVEMVRQFPQVGVMLPKTEAKDDITNLRNRLTKEQRIIPLIESAKGILSIQDIATSNDIDRFAFGAIDYCLELGVTLSETEEELIYPRSLLALVSRSVNLPSPIDTVFPKLDDDLGLRKKTKRAKQLGLFSSLCIHPKQVEIIHEELQPKAEIAWAEKVVKTFRDAEKKGIGSIKLDGEMIDYPVYQQAKEILSKEIKQ